MAENENTGGFIVISDWMVSDLHLKGTELILFAIIHGFTMSTGGFSGGMSYLQWWTNCSKPGVLKCIKALEQSGLIQKSKRVTGGKEYNVYRSTKFTGTGQQSLPVTSQQSLPDGSTKFTEPVNKVYGTGKQSLPNNILYNNNNIYSVSVSKEYRETETKGPPTPTQGEGNKPPSLAEVSAYCREIQSTVDAGAFYDHYCSCGWKVNGVPMEDWKARIRSWDREDRANGKTTRPENRPGYTEEPDPLDGVF